MYFLKQKSEVFETFNVFKALVENMSGNKIKVLRNENGKEYLNKKFHKLCEECGIHMKHSMSYTPQQNGVAKHKNISLKEMATCMMEEKDLNTNIQDEAIKCISYVHTIATHK